MVDIDLSRWPFRSMTFGPDDSEVINALWVDFNSHHEFVRFAMMGWLCENKSELALIWPFLVRMKRSAMNMGKLLDSYSSRKIELHMNQLIPCSRSAIDRAVESFLEYEIMKKGDWYVGRCTRELCVNWPVLAKALATVRWPSNLKALSFNLWLKSRPQAALMTTLWEVYQEQGPDRLIQASGQLLARHCEHTFGPTICPRTINRARVELTSMGLIENGSEGMRLIPDTVLSALEVIEALRPENHVRW